MTGHGSSAHPIGAFRAALTGGVGSGKSTVGELLVGRGAAVIDADIIAREVVEPGTPGLAAIVERFGPGILAPDATLNRAGLAAIVFTDAAALADLNAITHPLIRARSMELIDAVPAGSVAIYELPLLAEGGPFGAESFDAIIVVEAPMAIRLARLAERGLPAEQAQARIAAQATDEQRRAIADYLIVNDRDLAALESQVDGLWPELQQRARELRPS